MKTPRGARTPENPMLPSTELALMGLVLLLLGTYHFGGDGLTSTSLCFWASTWFLDLTRAKNHRSDFSAGLMYCFTLALVGEALPALLIFAGSFFVRRIGQPSNRAWEMLWVLPSLLLLVSRELFFGGVTLAWNLGALALALFLSYFGSQKLCQTWRREGKSRDAMIEERQRLLRLFLFGLPPLVLALPESRQWTLVLATPTLLGLQQLTLALGYRLKAEEGKVAKVEAHRSKKQLVRVQDKLGKATEKREILEQLVQVFEQNLSAAEAFAELTRVTRSVVSYRSIILFRLSAQQYLEPTHHQSPEKDLLLKAQLTLRKEPLVSKAWQQDTALLGEASPHASERLLPSERSLIAIPLKPFGVLYFGRDAGPPFTKEEASKLRYIAQSARASLVQAERSEHSQKVLEKQIELSQELQERVVYTSILLEGAQEILDARTQNRVIGAFQKLLEQAVKPGLVLLLDDSRAEKLAHWGLPISHPQALPSLLSFVRKQNRALYLNNLENSRFDSPHPGLRSLLTIPLSSQGASKSFLLVGSETEAAFSREEHDYICTCGCLLAAGLESLSLNLRLKEAHQQVVQASKLSAIGRLAAGVAHELNTPLAAIGLALDAATINPERSAKKLQRAGRALDRARDIVDNLLEHSRRSGSERSLTAIPDILEGVIELTEAQLQQKQQKLVLHSERVESYLLANKTDIQQVLINLILNSSDASPPGAQIELRVEERDACLFLSVTDYGSGIAPEVSDKIFDAFFTTKEVGSGTGLGLSVCRELVQRHQGEIAFQSIPDEKTRFTLTFPAMKS